MIKQIRTLFTISAISTATGIPKATIAKYSMGNPVSKRNKEKVKNYLIIAVRKCFDIMVNEKEEKSDKKFAK